MLSSAVFNLIASKVKVGESLNEKVTMNMRRLIYQNHLIILIIQPFDLWSDEAGRAIVEFRVTQNN
jgi:hypothetical protein